MRKKNYLPPQCTRNQHKNTSLMRMRCEYNNCTATTDTHTHTYTYQRAGSQAANWTTTKYAFDGKTHTQETWIKIGHFLCIVAALAKCALSITAPLLWTRYNRITELRMSTLYLLVIYTFLFFALLALLLICSLSLAGRFAFAAATIPLAAHVVLHCRQHFIEFRRFELCDGIFSSSLNQSVIFTMPYNVRPSQLPTAPVPFGRHICLARCAANMQKKWFMQCITLFMFYYTFARSLPANWACARTRA